MSDPIMLDMGTKEIEVYHRVSYPMPAHYQSGGWAYKEEEVTGYPSTQPNPH